MLYVDMEVNGVPVKVGGDRKRWRVINNIILWSHSVA